MSSPLLLLILADRSLAKLSSKRLHTANKGDRCRDPEANIGWSLGNPVEEGKEEHRSYRGQGHQETTYRII